MHLLLANLKNKKPSAVTIYKSDLIIMYKLYGQANTIKLTKNIKLKNCETTQFVTLNGTKKLDLDFIPEIGI